MFIRHGHQVPAGRPVGADPEESITRQIYERIWAIHGLTPAEKRTLLDVYDELSGELRKVSDRLQKVSEEIGL